MSYTQVTGSVREAKQRLYKISQCKALRKAQLAKQPICYLCNEVGIETQATVADHHVPHRGDTRLFHNPNNLRSVCDTCHNSTKQRYEKSGYWQGCGDSGTPLDPRHHWNS